MTDSFHGAVFSHLYERKFVVSSECGNEMGGCRLQSLTDLFETQNRYIKDHEMVSLDKLLDLASAPMELNIDQYEMMRCKSIAFLKGALEYKR